MNKSKMLKRFEKYFKMLKNVLRFGTHGQDTQRAPLQH